MPVTGCGGLQHPHAPSINRAAQLVPRQPTFPHYRRVASDPALWDNYASISLERLAELLDCEGPEVSLSIPGAVSALPTAGCPVRVVENVRASAGGVWGGGVGGGGARGGRT